MCSLHLQNITVGGRPLGWRRQNPSATPVTSPVVTANARSTQNFKSPINAARIILKSRRNPPPDSPPTAGKLPMISSFQFWKMFCANYCKNIFIPLYDTPAPLHTGGSDRFIDFSWKNTENTPSHLSHVYFICHTTYLLTYLFTYLLTHSLT
jgi:hypothetical protein